MLTQAGSSCIQLNLPLLPEKPTESSPTSPHPLNILVMMTFAVRGHVSKTVQRLPEFLSRGGPSLGGMLAARDVQIRRHWRMKAEGTSRSHQPTLLHTSLTHCCMHIVNHSP